MNYYNDHEPYAAQWLKNLVAAGLLPPGKVDSRDIQEVTADELREFTQCHFFAGIGGWPLALQLAGWPATRPVWTGSCPCQPFSVAGKGAGTKDHRHLWPEFRRLIAERKPAKVFGEQVASADGRKWLAGVRADLETLGYGVGASDLCAAGISAPHIRQRLFWVAEPSGAECDGWAQPTGECGRAFHPANSGSLGGIPYRESLRRGEEHTNDAGCSERTEAQGEAGRITERCNACGMAYPECKPGCPEYGKDQRERQSCRTADFAELNGNSPDGGPGFRLSDTNRSGCGELCGPLTMEQEQLAVECDGGGVWSDFNVIPCGDGKARRLKPGLAPLVDGLPGRVGQIRAYGNAIVPQVAAEFIKAFLAARP